MGLDIYAGTLTRYYAHNWKTVVQQWAEENGYGFNRISPNGEQVEEEELPLADVMEIVCGWRDWITKAVTPEGVEPYQPWPEDNEKAYYTDKPDWPALGALMVYGASLLYREPFPKTVEKHWDFNQEPLIQRAYGDEKAQWSLYTGTELWLPIQDCFTFTAQNPAQNQVPMSTAGMLLAELGWINSNGWNAPEEEFLNWDRTEGYPTDAAIAKDGTLGEVQEHTVYNTESLAKFAFCIFYKAARYSLEHQVPILLDY